ncbi:P-loop containing nucleoside triphosphate hydrolase protein [Cladochytrium replicatum]|nr:P-loop containing nucleoside triphosphate hydrolase protein [Cladochytrium replicatum]
MLDSDFKSLSRLSVLLLGASAVGKSDLISTFLANPSPQGLQPPSRPLSRKPSFLPSSSSSSSSTTRRTSRRSPAQPRPQSNHTPTLEDSHSIQYAFHPSLSNLPQSPSDSAARSSQSQRLTLRIIDIGGAPELTSLLPSAIAASEAFVFVFDLTDRTSFDSIAGLHRKVLDAAARRHAPFVLVGNKADKEGRQVDRDSGERLASLMGAEYFETSGYDSEAVSSMFRAVVQGAWEGRANATPVAGTKQGISQLSRRRTLSSSSRPLVSDDTTSPKLSAETRTEDDATTVRASTTTTPLLVRTRSILNVLIGKPSEISVRGRASSESWTDTASNGSSAVRQVGTQSGQFEEESSEDEDDFDEGIRSAAAEMGLGLRLQWAGAAAVLATGRA